MSGITGIQAHSNLSLEWQHHFWGNPKNRHPFPKTKIPKNSKKAIYFWENLHVQG